MRGLFVLDDVENHAAKAVYGVRGLPGAIHEGFGRQRKEGTEGHCVAIDHNDALLRGVFDLAHATSVSR